MARTTRWLALCALAVIVSAFLGLLALDLAWRLGGSSTAESARGEETGAVYLNSFHRSPFHHTRADAMEHVDIALLAQVANGVTRVLLELAGERPLSAQQVPSATR